MLTYILIASVCALACGGVVAWRLRRQCSLDDTASGINRPPSGRYLLH